MDGWMDRCDRCDRCSGVGCHHVLLHDTHGSHDTLYYCCDIITIIFIICALVVLASYISRLPLSLSLLLSIPTLANTQHDPTLLVQNNTHARDHDAAADEQKPKEYVEL
jgi:hypothetical protein